MNKTEIKFIQRMLNERGLDAGEENGIAGSKTMIALDRVSGIPTDWSQQRKLTGFIQLLAKEKNIETGKFDGYWGPQTQFAFDNLKEIIKTDEPPLIWRPEEISSKNPNNWPSQVNEQDLINFYGNVGENQKRIHLPYPHKLSWDKNTIVNSFMCHEKVHDSLLRVLNKVFLHYGLQEIKRLHLDLWGGCLNVRPMRGGTRYSMHSWGIALDYDPDRNQLQWGRDKAAFARPEYNAWWSFWEEEGWVSLGRTRNFDWMHVQASGL